MTPKASRVTFGLACIAAGLIGGAWILGVIIGLPLLVWGLLTKEKASE